MTITEMQDQAWAIAEQKGFHEDRTNDGRDDTLVRLCLIHSEVTEAVQLVKKHWAPDALCVTSEGSLLDQFGAELADILIRVGDLAGCVGVDLERHVREKMEKNKVREYLYGTPHAKGSGQ